MNMVLIVMERSTETIIYTISDNVPIPRVGETIKIPTNMRSFSFTIRPVLGVEYCYNSPTTVIVYI